MKRLFSTRYSEFSFNLSMLLLRAGTGILLFAFHGLPKLQKFEERKDTFSDPLGIGHTPSLVLVIFAEVFCALLIVMGMLTRVAAFVLVVLFSVIIFMAHKGKPWNESELALLFLLAAIAVLFCGPGKWSLDKLIGK
jgi:putative oxidoreductase